MNSEKDYISIRDILIDEINYKPFLNLNYHIFKKTGIILLLIILIIVLIHGFIYDFTILDNICALVYAAMVTTLAAIKFDKKNDRILNHVFTCPHCLKNILVKNIDKIKCPHCDAEDLTFHQAVFGCPHCEDPVRLLNCPHCQEAIDLDAPYYVHQLKERRYEPEEILSHD